MTSTLDASDATAWPVVGLFLDALAHRDFTAMASCLDTDVRFRALVPPGPFDAAGATATMETFQHWFGGDDEFEVVDASLGHVGGRLYLRWRVRMRSASDPDSSRVAEQHVFATAGERIQSLDLLCCGWQAETGAPRCLVG